MKHYANLDIRGAAKVSGAFRVNSTVEAGGFYLTVGANGLGHDIGQQDIQFDIPSVVLDEYYLDNFVSQGYIVEEVALATNHGSAEVGFYIMGPTKARLGGIGIASAQHSIYGSLGDFYVMPVLRKLTATAANVVRPNDSLVMSCFQTSSATHLRGRVRIKLNG